jgi:hypothetical protein
MAQFRSSSTSNFIHHSRVKKHLHLDFSMHQFPKVNKKHIHTLVVMRENTQKDIDLKVLRATNDGQ